MKLDRERLNMEKNKIELERQEKIVKSELEKTATLQGIELEREFEACERDEGVDEGKKCVIRMKKMISNCNNASV